MSDLEVIDSKFSEPNKVIGIKPIKKVKTYLEDSEKDQHAFAEELIEKARKKLEAAEANADELLLAARETISREKTEWEVYKEQVKNEAQEQGFQIGLEQGRQKGYQEYKELLDQTREVILLAKNDYQNILTESEDVIAHIALKAASKILKSELEMTDNYINLVRHVLKEVKEQTKIVIYSHPEDYKLLLTQKDELLNIVHFDADLSLYPDGELERGSCMIESPYGMINAGVDSQLQELREKLFELSKEKAVIES